MQLRLCCSFLPHSICWNLFLPKTTLFLNFMEKMVTYQRCCQAVELTLFYGNWFTTKISVRFLNFCITSLSYCTRLHGLHQSCIDNGIRDPDEFCHQMHLHQCVNSLVESVEGVLTVLKSV